MRFCRECEVTRDADLDAVFEKVKTRFGRIDVLVHSVAFANPEDLGGRFLEPVMNSLRLFNPHPNPSPSGRGAFLPFHLRGKGPGDEGSSS